LSKKRITNKFLISLKKTTKDGGTGKGRKSAIVDILEYENRLLYFNKHSEIDSIQLPKCLCIK